MAVLSVELRFTELPERYRRYLGRAGIVTIGQLLARSEEQLYEIRNFGHQAIRAARWAVARYAAKMLGWHSRERDYLLGETWLDHYPKPVRIPLYRGGPHNRYYHA